LEILKAVRGAELSTFLSFERFMAKATSYGRSCRSCRARLRDVATVDLTHVGGWDSKFKHTEFYNQQKKFGPVTPRSRVFSQQKETTGENVGQKEH
jgi:hypothetical protein